MITSLNCEYKRFMHLIFPGRKITLLLTIVSKGLTSRFKSKKSHILIGLKTESLILHIWSIWCIWWGAWLKRENRVPQKTKKGRTYHRERKILTADEMSYRTTEAPFCPLR